MHNISHPGMLASPRLASSRYVWCGLARDVAAWTKTCLHCQQSKTHHHIKTCLLASLSPSPILLTSTSILWDRYNLVTIATTSLQLFIAHPNGGKPYPFLPLAQWPGHTLLYFLGLPVLGCPPWSLLYHKPQFTSSLRAELCDTLSIVHHQTTAYHPEANGVVERLHHCLKDALRAPAAAATCANEIPWVLFSLHLQPREDIGLSPAEAVFGAPLFCLTTFCRLKNFLLIKLLTSFIKS